MRVGRVIFYFLSQFIDMYRDCRHVSYSFCSQDMVKNPLSCKDDIRISGQKQKKPEFPSCKFQLVFPFIYAVRSRIDSQLAGRDTSSFLPAFSVLWIAYALLSGPSALQAERLYNIVIPPRARALLILSISSFLQ